MKILAAQGELRIYKIQQFPKELGNKRTDSDANGNFILAHSEKGITM